MTPAEKADALKTFLATRGPTRCPPAETHAAPLSRMRREHERRLAGDLIEVASIETQAERYQERFGAARASGASISEALDCARGFGD